jgi:hypothetical protein
MSLLTSMPMLYYTYDHNPSAERAARPPQFFGISIHRTALRSRPGLS